MAGKKKKKKDDQAEPPSLQQPARLQDASRLERGVRAPGAEENNLFTVCALMVIFYDVV